MTLRHEPYALRLFLSIPLVYLLDRNVKIFKFWNLIFLVFLFYPSPVKADWVNLTGAQSAPNIAEIYIEDDHVRLVLEIYVGDLDKFIELLPDDWFKNTKKKPPPSKERIKLFSEKTFQFILDDNKQLSAKLTLTEPRLRQDRPNPFAGSINPYTRQPIPGPPDDKRVLYAELVYPFDSKPSSLTIIPPLEKGGTPSVSIGFILFHKGVSVVDYRYLTSAAKLTLDWEDPWYSRFETKALKRWQQSGLRTFLYIEPFEVRHETLVRVKDLEAWMDLGLRGNEFIEVDEFNPLKKRVGEFFMKHSNVLIEGKKLPSILDRTSFVKYTMTRTFFIEQPERMHLNTALVGVIITYLTEGLPKEVSVDWDLFSDRIQRVPTNAVDPAGPFPSYVTPEDNILKWTNFLKNYKIPTVAELAVDETLIKLKIPVGTVLCLLALLPLAFQIRKKRHSAKAVGLIAGLVVFFIAGSIVLFPYMKVAVARPTLMVPKMTDKVAVEILQSLLKNVYRSFDLRKEEDVYDRLATSVNGDLLAEIYLQNRKSLVVTQAGGAQAKVREIDILEVAVDHLDDRPLALLFRSKWTAMGNVGHWGHIHTRQNQYEANITVEPVAGVWKITGLELLEEKRIDPYANQKTS
jgi:hypothetical protein